MQAHSAIAKGDRRVEVAAKHRPPGVGPGRVVKNEWRHERFCRQPGEAGIQQPGGGFTVVVPGNDAAAEVWVSIKPATDGGGPLIPGSRRRMHEVAEYEQL